LTEEKTVEQSSAREPLEIQGAHNILFLAGIIGGVLFSSALGKFYPGLPEAEAVTRLIVEKIPYLAAISAGAVFIGANTYIGNAPNFMVKSIAEEAGVAMPSFFGYIFKYSLPILVALFILMTFIFF
jgi:Na+/H+ antiporter NhaD/arsenite permease-like protein